jgi:hypothetical protein
MTKQQRQRTVAFLLAMGLLAGCAKEAPPSAASDSARISAGPAATVAASAAAVAASPLDQKPNVTNRKIIRQAELELEVPAPGATQPAIERLAEQHGGFVVSAARDTENGSAVDVRVTVTVRVPQAELMSTIAELKHFGRGVGSERVTSDDVTDEYVDLAARTTSQKQLEQQYLELLKRAANVKDAMEVERALADVRTEIERMEGRQRLLEKESTFSTLTVHLTTAVPQVAVSSSGFSGTIRRAWADSLSLSADLISGAIRFAGFFLPVLLLIVLPTGLLIWALKKLAHRRRAALLAHLS